MDTNIFGIKHLFIINHFDNGIMFVTENRSATLALLSVTYIIKWTIWEMLMESTEIEQNNPSDNNNQPIYAVGFEMAKELSVEISQ